MLTFVVMKVKRKPKGKIEARIKKMYDEAAAKGEAQYQKDLAAAVSAEGHANKTHDLPYNAKNQINITDADRQQIYKMGHAIAGKDAELVKAVQAKKAAGGYSGSVPVAGTNSKKVMRKNNPIKGIKKSEASASVKKKMAKKLKASTK